mmetsp:Transcript_17181/g.65158  ORF Transcript_17181/g.65158 Transcript_17181/m.65158 type:complete len:248 (-) Transcript_17181:1028-1771(-)
MVPATTALSRRPMSSGKGTGSLADVPPLTNQDTIPEKMRWRVEGVISVKQITLRWRIMRGEMALRPPPGGPIAAATRVSSRRMKVLSSRLYQPLLSVIWRSSSMGGWAPYSSICGMLRSSTKMTHVWPGRGPYTPLRRRSILRSTWFWVKSALVCAEKPITIGIHCSRGSVRSSRRFMSTLLPVPVGPQASTRRPRVSSMGIRWSNCSVATDGMTMSWKFAPCAMAAEGRQLSQVRHLASPAHHTLS